MSRARSARLRFPRALTACTLMLLTLVLGWAPRSAVAADDGCTETSGVTVVVDLRQLGGGILERCAPGLTGSANGLAALSAAGIPYQGTSQWGSAFMCRLLGRPTATESLSLPGNSNYHELCITTPPATAYWAYWWAPNGGPWRYSDSGVTAHRITPGGFEGWVFTLRSGAGTGPPPGITPVMTYTAPGTVAIKPTPAASQPRASSAPATGTVPSTDSVSASSSAPASPGAVSSSAAAVAGSPTAAPSSGATSEPLTSSNLAQVGGAAQPKNSGPGTGLIVGICLLAFLVTVGAGTAWRRTHSGGGP
jgi:hypothetical protein